VELYTMAVRESGTGTVRFVSCNEYGERGSYKIVEFVSESMVGRAAVIMEFTDRSPFPGTFRLLAEEALRIEWENLRNYHAQHS
jgi:hypothetical protein